MPATRSRASTEQPAEVAAEEVKQVQEEGSEIVPEAPAQTDVVKPAAETAVIPEPEQTEQQPASEPAAEPAVAPDAVTNGSAEPVVAAAAADTNGESDVVPAGTNGSAAVSQNGVAAEAVAVDESAPEAAAEAESDAKRKSEVGDGDAVPDSTDVKKLKVGEAEPVAEEAAAVDATA